MKEKSINKKEVLRYLGYKNQAIDEITNKLIEQSMEEIKKITNERYVYKLFDISRENNKIFLKESNFELMGEDIKKHLKNSDQCILMAITLGHDVDTRIRYYEKISMDKALILDACASTIIEEISDRLCKEIEENLKKNNKALTRRYSPGYGDLSLDIQGEFLSIIDAKKTIGLTSTSNSILIPRKSITAIMGIVDIKNRKRINNCINCNNYNSCIFSKGDENCGA